jgi:hypothetical protein
MKRLGWQGLLGISLVLLSAVLYFFHYTVFHDVHHIFIYLVGDVAFVPIEVLLVTVIIHRLLSQREKRARLEKLNMVIGVFFSETGTTLLTRLSDYDPNLGDIRENLLVSPDWSEQKFTDVVGRMRTYGYSVDITKVDLEDLRRYLIEKRDFHVRLLENPNLLEHETFTGLLRAVFHLTEELESRGDIATLPESDRQHLAGDIKRAYVRLVQEWLDYMKHLKQEFPYLFSLALRLNPFDLETSPVVK